MTYNEALKYIHSVEWRGSKPGLSRTQELLRCMGDPQNSLKFVHIVGTNGKGSTAAMLDSVLRCSGFKTGLYTSPFIEVFNERMQINGVPIENDELADIVDYIRIFADKMADAPTEFELITAIAMEYFKRNSCDIVILEAGMGGELDSTNVIPSPEAAVVTAIGLDHTRELGDTVEKIAATKAGVIKPGCTAVYYGDNPSCLRVIRDRCESVGAELAVPALDTVRHISCSLSGNVFDFGTRKSIHLSLIGKYQVKNAAVVIETVEALRRRGWCIPEECLLKGLSEAAWKGRFEILHSAFPTVITDGGHNPHGVTATADTLRAVFPGKKITFVIGIMADKDVDGVINILAPLAKSFFCVQPSNPRAMKADVLARRISCLCNVPAVPCTSICDGVAEAVAEAMQAGNRNGSSNLHKQTCTQAGMQLSAQADMHDSEVVFAIGSLYMYSDIKESVKRVLGGSL